MKFFVFLEKWIYFRNKNILCGYKKLLIDLFHNIFWLQKVYHESKKRARPPILEGFEQKLFYSSSSQRKYHQIKNADFMRHSTASVSSNVVLFISFSKTLVAN